MKFEPLSDRILVKRATPKEISRGGIIIPENAKERPVEGEVLAVGSGRRNDVGDLIAVHVAVGDRVLFGKYAGTEVQVDGEEYTVLREDDVLGRLAQ